MLRQEYLAQEIANLIRSLVPDAKQCLDIGAQNGNLARMIGEIATVCFVGLEPKMNTEWTRINGVKILRGQSHNLPFPDTEFDVVTVISVFEHIEPPLILPSLFEIKRVLRPRGLLIVQMPNMLFPIEPHSLLPMQQYLPRRIGLKYLHLFSPNRGYDGNWFITTPRKVFRLSRIAGLRLILYRRLTYASEIFPPRLRCFVPLIRIFPLDFIFVMQT